MCLCAYLCKCMTLSDLEMLPAFILYCFFMFTDWIQKMPSFQYFLWILWIKGFFHYSDFILSLSTLECETYCSPSLWKYRIGNMLASHCIIYPQDIVDPGTCTEFFLKNLISLTVLALRSVKILEKEVSMDAPECWFYALEITYFSCEMLICLFWVTGCNGNGCKSKASSSGAEDCES